MNFNKNLIVATIAVALVSSSSVSAICPIPGHFYCPITADCELPADCNSERARGGLRQSTTARRSLQTPEEEAPTAMPILSGVSTPTEAPTEMPILSGVGTPTEMPILPGVTTPTAKPTHHHHSSSAAALSSTKTIQQYHIAVVATLAASSIVVALVL